MKIPIHFLPFRTLTLRYKTGLVFVFPVIFTLFIISGAHYLRDRAIYTRQLELTTLQLAELTKDRLRHSLFDRNSAEIQTSLAGVIQQESITRAWVVGLDGQVKYSGKEEEIGLGNSANDPGCIECHQSPAVSRPIVTHLAANPDVVRVSLPFKNTTRCHACHDASKPVLGTLLIDASMDNAYRELSKEIATDMGLALLVLIITTFMGFGMIQWLVVRRVEVIYSALMKFGTGDFSVRIPITWRTTDELTQLALQFNDFAKNFEILRKEHDEKENVRVNAIVEERERIARELHDGVAQFLAYVSTKTVAILRALKNNKIEVAQRNLEQLEEVAKNQSIEVRASIIGLKMSGQVDQVLATNIVAFAEQCNRLFDFHIEVEISPGAQKLRLGAETELQLMRIFQESISNVRKHAQATRVIVRLEQLIEATQMIIEDDGQGFDQTEPGNQLSNHFGLQIMRERANAIGATIKITSVVGHGTQVIVNLPIAEVK